jgi:hypothetical protein
LTERPVEREGPLEPRRHAVVDGRYLHLVTDLGDLLDEESRPNAARAAGYQAMSPTRLPMCAGPGW